MGKKLRDEDLVLNVIVNGDKAKKELGDLEQSTRDLKSTNKDLRAEKEKLKRAGLEESDRYKEINALIKQNNTTIKANEARMKELRTEMGVSGMTMKQLRQEARRLQTLLDNSTYGTDNWRKYRAELDKVEAQMGKVKAKSKGLKATLGKLADGFNKFSVMGAAVVATLTGIVFSIKEWVNGMVTLDDELSDIMKTTGMTKKQVRELNSEFKNLNTRTSRTELRGLAEEAGRLGKRSKQDVMDFVEVANQIAVALGDDLGDTQKAVREVGKLTNIYKVGAQYGTNFKDSMSKIGSAVNEVSANSSAQADYLIGYLKRMGGVADQADVNAAQILGYASTLDQLGQAQEMAATAQGKVMIDMFKDSAKYAKIAKMDTGEFAQLLETDANEAFLKLLEGLNGSNEGMSVMAKKLDDLGIDGARAVQVLSAMASNTDIIRREQALANDAMEKGVSLMNEYKTKNENFAASVSKISKYIKSKFINSSFLGWIEKVTNKMAEWTKVDVSKTLKDQKKNVNLLAIEMTSANTSAERRNEIYEELQGIAPEIVKNIDKENISVSTLRKNLEQYNMAMIKKLALHDSEQALEKEREKAGEATKERIEKELQLEEELYSIQNQAKKYNADLVTQIAEINLSSDDVITKQEKVISLLGNQRRFYRTNADGLTSGILEARKAEKEATDDVTKAMEDYMSQYNKVFNQTEKANEGQTPEGSSSGNNGNTYVSLTEEQKQFAKLQQQLQNELANAGYANLKDGIEKETALENQRWDEEKAKLEAKLITKQNLSAEEIAYNDDVYALIEEKKQTHLNKIADLEKADEERKNAEKALKEAEQAEIDLLNAETDEEKWQAELDLAQTRYEQEFEAAEGNRLKELQAKKKYEQSIDKINADRDKKELQRLVQSKELTLTKLDIAKQALGVMRTLAGEETALGKALFVAQQAIAVAQIIVNTAIANAKAVAASPLTFGQPWVTINTISGGLGVASVLAQTITGLEDGGYTDVVRAQDGKPYRAQIRQKRGFVDKPSVLVGEDKPEFVANGDAVENPTVKPFLDIIDYHQRAGDIHSLDLNSVFSTMPSMRGYEGGGYTQTETTLLPSGPTSDNSIISIIQQSTETTQELNSILKKGIRAIVIYKELEEMKEEVETITNAANF